VPGPVRGVPRRARRRVSRARSRRGLPSCADGRAPSGGGVRQHAVQAGRLPPLREQIKLGELDHRVRARRQRGEKPAPPPARGQRKAKSRRESRRRARSPRQSRAAQATRRSALRWRGGQRGIAGSRPRCRAGPLVRSTGVNRHDRDERDREQHDRAPPARPPGTACRGSPGCGSRSGRTLGCRRPVRPRTTTATSRIRDRDPEREFRSPRRALRPP